MKRKNDPQWFEKAVAEEEAREQAIRERFIGVNLSGVPQYLVCNLCGAFVDPEYSRIHMERCR